MSVGKYGVAGGVRPGHVEFPERFLVFGELPFIEEAESAHAEREHGRDGGCGCEEGRGV